MKKILALLTVLLLTTAMLTGCGGSSSTAAQDMAISEEAPAEVIYGNTSSSSTADSVSTVSEQKLIKRVRIDAETEDLDSLMESLGRHIASLGGYIESQEIYNGSSYSTYRYKSANLTIRIPAEQLDGFVSQVKGLSNVVNYTETADDVTLTYVATESRIAALEAEEARLLELMGQAETMSDLLEIEERLTEVRSDLESLTSQLRVLSNQVSYATVSLSIDQVKVYTEVEEPSVWQRISSGFTRNLDNIGESLVDFFVWVVTYSPQLIFWAAVITAGVILGRRAVGKRKKSKMPPSEQP